jgi:hypothetical protein
LLCNRNSDGPLDGSACPLLSFTATEVASHRFGVEIAPRLAAAKRALWRITGRGAARLLAVTAYHRRAKTPDRILRRDDRKVAVIRPVPLCAFPGRRPRWKARIGPARYRGDQEQRAQTDTKKEQGRSELDDGETPPSAIAPTHELSHQQVRSTVTAYHRESRPGRWLPLLVDLLHPVPGLGMLRGSLKNLFCRSGMPFNIAVDTDVSVAEFLAMVFGENYLCLYHLAHWCQYIGG